MIREVKFESQDRRIKQILACLNKHGIASDLLRECQMGLCRWYSHRTKGKSQGCRRGCQLHRRRPAVVLHPRISGRRP